MADPLRANGMDVELLGALVNAGESGLDHVPIALVRVIKSNKWRHYVDALGNEHRHARFEDFVRARPTAGIGTTIDWLRRACSCNAEALDAIERAQTEDARPGNPTMIPGAPSVNPSGVERVSTDEPIVDIIHNRPEPTYEPRPTGTSRAAGLRKLQRHAPELAAAAARGETSVHGALVQSGLRRRQTPLGALRVAWRRASAEERAEFLTEVQLRDGRRSG